MWLHLSLLTWKPFFTMEHNVGMKRVTTAGDVWLSLFTAKHSTVTWMRDIYVSKYDKHIFSWIRINNKFIGLHIKLLSFLRNGWHVQFPFKITSFWMWTSTKKLQWSVKKSGHKSFRLCLSFFVSINRGCHNVMQRYEKCEVDDPFLLSELFFLVSYLSKMFRKILLNPGSTFKSRWWNGKRWC